MFETLYLALDIPLSNASSNTGYPDIRYITVFSLTAEKL